MGCDGRDSIDETDIEDAKAEARKEAINEAIAVIQEAREEGETDHRTMIYRLQHLLLR